MNSKKKLSLDIKKDDQDLKILLKTPKETPRFENLNSVDPYLSKMNHERKATHFFQITEQKPQHINIINNFFTINNSIQPESIYQKFETSQKYIDNKSKINSLKELFEKIFLNQEVELKNFNFNQQTLKLIELIINRKFFKTASKNTNNISEAKIQEKILTVRTLTSKKRLEENNKFVFKGVMKVLKNKFYKKHGIKHNRTNEENFFKEYFQQDALLNGLDIIQYYDPLNISSINQTLNIDYLKRIFSNQKFKEDFLNAMNVEFILQYQKSLKKKISTLFEKYHRKMKKSGDEAATNKFIYQLRNSKRFKFPWFINEVDEALRYFKSHINNLFQLSPNQSVMLLQFK